MKKALTMALGVAGIAVAAQAAAQVTFYEREGFRGRSFNADRPIADMNRFGFNDRAASAVIEDGNWEVCEDARFSGRCVVLQPGRYGNLSDVGLKFQISSVRPVEGNGRSAQYDNRRDYNARPDYNNRPGEYNAGPSGRAGLVQDDNYRRRQDEDVYTADVTAVRAVVGEGGQRCWMEQQQVNEPRSGNGNGAQIGGAIAGALIGGILGHQVGGGRGRDVATAAGAVGGALAGSNIAGRSNRGDVVSTQEVQRCTSGTNDRPSYYDVTYFFRGQEHRVQMSAPPGPTIAVNGDGEPRI
ncbi:MAG: beta/gamma crystallin-related protein [Pseudomonadota bacterium]|nr:beta/gamma crystallin-related protein [Pseudomonadota bacterium]